MGVAMDLNELIDRHQNITDDCLDRLSSDVARDQYDFGDQQKFETMSNGDLLEGMREELLDAINYIVFLLIKVDAMAARAKL
jgi:hypothetical protein